nr:MAG TPA: hypothetical protein [Caudoviricetes sp.]
MLTLILFLNFLYHLYHKTYLLTIELFQDHR